MEETEITKGRMYLASRAESKLVCLEHGEFSGEWQELKPGNVGRSLTTWGLFWRDWGENNLFFLSLKFTSTYWHILHSYNQSIYIIGHFVLLNCVLINSLHCLTFFIIIIVRTIEYSIQLKYCNLLHCLHCPYWTSRLFSTFAILENATIKILIHRDLSFWIVSSG